MMDGHQVPGVGTGDDGYDEEGYDESQRAEILEATRDGPTDGTVLTDLDPDLGDDSDDDEDDLELEDDEDTSADRTVPMRASAIDEDDVQEEFDDGSVEDDELDDADDEALNP